jgi:tripartite-type tricarboxylate transporter receptor subunit TctC
MIEMHRTGMASGNHVKIRRSILVGMSALLLANERRPFAQEARQAAVRLIIDRMAYSFAQLFVFALGDTLKARIEPLGRGPLSAYREVSIAEADGQTLLFSGPTIAAIAGMLPPSDPIAKLRAIALLNHRPLLLAAPSTFATNLKGLVAHLRRASSVTYASNGDGSASHLAGYVFARELGVSAIHVPYRGAAPAQLAVEAGTHDFMFNDWLTYSPYHPRSGRIAIIGSASDARLKELPLVPTIREELGIPVSAKDWDCMCAPSAVDGATIDKMHRAIIAALKMDSVRLFAERIPGMLIGDSTPQQSDTFLRTEMAKWGPIAKAAGVSVG